MEFYWASKSNFIFLRQLRWLLLRCSSISVLSEFSHDHMLRLGSKLFLRFPPLLRCFSIMCLSIISADWPICVFYLLFNCFHFCYEIVIGVGYYRWLVLTIVEVVILNKLILRIPILWHFYWFKCARLVVITQLIRIKCCIRSPFFDVFNLSGVASCKDRFKVTLVAIHSVNSVSCLLCYNGVDALYRYIVLPAVYTWLQVNRFWDGFGILSFYLLLYWWDFSWSRKFVKGLRNMQVTWFQFLWPLIMSFYCIIWKATLFSITCNLDIASLSLCIISIWRFILQHNIYRIIQLGQILLLHFLLKHNRKRRRELILKPIDILRCPSLLEIF